MENICQHVTRIAGRYFFMPRSWIQQPEKIVCYVFIDYFKGI